jgi:hypothetical protein
MSQELLRTKLSRGCTAVAAIVLAACASDGPRARQVVGVVSNPVSPHAASPGVVRAAQHAEACGLSCSHKPTLALQAAPIGPVSSKPSLAPTRSAHPGDGPIQRGDLQRVPPALRPFVAVVEVDQTRLRALAQGGGGILRGVPLDPMRSVDLALVPMEPFTADAVLESVGAGPVASKPLSVDGAILAGEVLGVEESRAFLASTAAGTFGFIEFPEETIIISSGRFGSGLPTVAYSLQMLPQGFIEQPAWTCEAEPGAPNGSDDRDSDSDSDFDSDPGSGEGVAFLGGGQCSQIRVAYDTDHEFLLLFGGDTDAAVGYVGTVAAAVTTIFSRDVDARLSASYLRLWLTPSDPWTATNLSTQLSQFRNHWVSNMGGTSRELAHFLSGRGLGGGIADLPGLCGGTSFGYGLSSTLNGFFPTPLEDNSAQNWDIYVIAHELGHNLGGIHTHSFLPPVDGCGLSPADCTNASQGTIMSYCAFCAGGQANIVLSFHPQNISAMNSYLASLGCSYTGAARAPVAVADAATAYAGVAKSIDVLGNDFPFNCEDIVIESFTAATAAGATVTRASSTGPESYDLLVYSLPAGSAFTGADTVSYLLRDTSGQTATGTLTVTVETLRAAENPVDTDPGLAARYYALSSPTALPNFAALTPYAAGTASALSFNLTNGDFAGSGRSDNVGAVFEGWIDAPASGGWTFTLTSDEGSRLLIGDTVVVSHDGLHAFTARSGSIGLAQGRHAFRVEYFERTGTAGLVASWEGPGVAFAAIPAANLWQGGRISPADFNQDGAVDAADLTLLLGDWGLPSSPYDLTGDDRVTAPDLSVLLFEWTG